MSYLYIKAINRTQEFTASFGDDADAVFLPEVLEAFRKALILAGYPYVTEIVAVTDEDGVEHSSINDV